MVSGACGSIISGARVGRYIPQILIGGKFKMASCDVGLATIDPDGL